MAALTTALIASAAIGAGASIYAGEQKNKGIKNAQTASNQSTQDQIAFAREGRDYARNILSKYSSEGDAARGRMNTFLGIKPTASGYYSGSMGGAKYGQYVDSNPDLKAAYGALKPDNVAQIARDGGDLNHDGQISQDEFGQYHYQTYGQNEGRTLPDASATATPSETQETAWRDYQDSPWGKIGTMEADKAKQDFMSMAGAQGSSLSGRTARGLQQVGEESQLRNFEKYFGALGGVADTGFNADTGIASGGQQFANTAVNATAANGRIAADLAMQKGQNNANTMDDLAGWIGWGAGNWPGGSGGSSGAKMAPTGFAPPNTSMQLNNGRRSRIS